MATFAFSKVCQRGDGRALDVGCGVCQAWSSCQGEVLPPSTPPTHPHPDLFLTFLPPPCRQATRLRCSMAQSYTSLVASSTILELPLMRVR